MSQRHSEYERVPGDFYATPSWVVGALLEAERFDGPIWECAPGEGHMVRALEAAGKVVMHDDSDFFAAPMTARHVITNPPYGKLAERFIRRSIELTKATGGKAAMLLPVNYDCAKGRRDLFDAPFKVKYVLTTRIRWANLPQAKASPSSNHSWLIWDWSYAGPAMLRIL